MNLAVGESASFEERRGEFMAAARLEYLQDGKGIYGVSIPVLTDIPQITSKLTEIVPKLHRRWDVFSSATV